MKIFFKWFAGSIFVLLFIGFTTALSTGWDKIHVVDGLIAIGIGA